MAHRKEDINPRIVDPYEEIYESFRGVVEGSLERFGNHNDIALIVGQAQAESLVRTLKSLSLKGLSRRDKVEYLHWMMTHVLSDVLKGEKGIVARMIIKETRAK